MEARERALLAGFDYLRCDLEPDLLAKIKAAKPGEHVHLSRVETCDLNMSRWFSQYGDLHAYIRDGRAWVFGRLVVAAE